MIAAGIIAVVGAPRATASAQHADSSGMPSLELLAAEAGRASRRHPIAAVAGELLCDPSHPLLDSAAVAACASLDPVRRALLTAAFARGLDVPLVAATESPSAQTVPVCPPELERRPEPRTLLVRLTPPVVGARDGRWEGRLAVDFRCYIGAMEPRGDLRVVGKEYLFQWTGTAWRLYQYAWRRTNR